MHRLICNKKVAVAVAVVVVAVAVAVVAVAVVSRWRKKQHSQQ